MKDYSILMSVYHKENPTYFRQAIESMLNQTIKSNDFVIVCDGPLTDELYMVIDEYASIPENHIHKIQLDKNYGLGIALNRGLNECKNELVARMDSDDISDPCRCEKQLKEFLDNDHLALVGTNVNEFIHSIDRITGKRAVPSTYKEIVKYSKKRNPFNHPTVMFNKEIIQNVGSYLEDYHLFEDYYLWVRVLSAGYYCKNISESLVFMRTSDDMYSRRGGTQYANEMLKFHRWLRDHNWINYRDFITGTVPHYIICVLPNNIRRTIYLKMRE